jgi:hypothetical protein
MFLGVLGVVIYVDPFERDFVAHSGVMEFSAVDSKYNIIFGRNFFWRNGLFLRQHLFCVRSISYYSLLVIGLIGSLENLSSGDGRNREEGRDE